MNAEKPTIAIVDDDMATLTMGSEILKASYDVTPVPSAEKFLEIIEKITPDLVLLDVEMPRMNGFDLIKKMKADTRLSGIPVIFLTSKREAVSEVEGFDLGAADYISKPFSPSILLKRVTNQLLIVRQNKDLLIGQARLKDYTDTLEERVKEKTRDLSELQNAILTTVADLVEFRDKLTGGHIARTQLYLKSLTKELVRKGIYKEIIDTWDMDLFVASAQLHDVGKIAISDRVLNKPAKLEPEEFEIMKTHVEVGVDVIEKIIINTKRHAFLHHALYVAGTHHEKWNGTGYPVGLKGLNIPLEGRLMAVADVYDALISVRPYKKSLPHAEACEIIECNSGTMFDPALIGVFKEVKSEFDSIAQRYKSKKV